METTHQVISAFHAVCAMLLQPNGKIVLGVSAFFKEESILRLPVTMSAAPSRAVRSLILTAPVKLTWQYSEIASGYLYRSTAGFTGIAFGAMTDKAIPNAFVL